MFFGRSLLACNRCGADACKNSGLEAENIALTVSPPPTLPLEESAGEVESGKEEEEEEEEGMEVSGEEAMVELNGPSRVGSMDGLAAAAALLNNEEDAVAAVAECSCDGCCCCCCC